MPGHKYIIGHFVLDVNTVKYKKPDLTGFYGLFLSPAITSSSVSESIIFRQGLVRLRSSIDLGSRSGIRKIISATGITHPVPELVKIRCIRIETIGVTDIVHPITVFLTFRRHHIHAMIFDKKRAIKTLNFSNNDVEHRISKTSSDCMVIVYLLPESYLLTAAAVRMSESDPSRYNSVSSPVSFRRNSPAGRPL